MLHRFATFVAGCTVLLILAGSLVTSHGAGLSVPDWPTSYGWNMFTFPPSLWVANILYEHGHRLIASTVGFLTIVLAAWLWMAESRRWLRWLGVAALVAVIAQGVLGGLTVLFFLPAPISTAHAGLAEIFFCLVVSIALFTSDGWIHGYRVRGSGFRVQGSPFEVQGSGFGIQGSAFGVQGSEPSTRNPAPSRKNPAPGTLNPEPDVVSRLRQFATATTTAIYTQILIGATMRHTGAGLAIPDFPLMFGRLVPPAWSSKIAVHFAHRVGAGFVVLTVLGTFRYIWTRLGDRRELVRPAATLVALVGLQVTLGALTVLSRLNPWINSVHVVVGALVLTTSLVLTLRSWRDAFPEKGVGRGFQETDSTTHEMKTPPDPFFDGARA